MRARSSMRRFNIALAIGAALAVSSCADLAPRFEAKPNVATGAGYRCPPLVRYAPEEVERARAEVEPGTSADRMLNDYHLMREMCR